VIKGVVIGFFLAIDGISRKEASPRTRNYPTNDAVGNTKQHSQLLTKSRRFRYIIGL
jgi:hypothetical protein